MQRVRITSLAAFAALFAITVAAPSGVGTAHAQKADDKKADGKKADHKKKAPQPDAEALADAKKAYGEGSVMFDAGDFKGAVGKFKLAFRLTRNPILLYNIAYTIDQMKDSEMALFYYKKFLQLGPKSHPNYDSAKKRAKKLARAAAAKEPLFDDEPVRDASAKKPKNPTRSTRRTKKPTKKPKTVAVAPKRPSVKEFMHNVIDEAPPGKPLDVTAFIPDGAKWQVNMYYRVAGQAKFVSVTMRPRYNELVGRIPAPKMSGTSVQYYIEARNKAGKVIARSGRAMSPNLVLVEETARPRYYPDLSGDTNYDTPVAKKEPLITAGGAGGWGDVHSNKFTYLKWGSTASAGLLLTIGIFAYTQAAASASSLEGEAFDSNMECAAPPCRAYSDYQKDLQSYGKRMNTVANVTLGLGVAATGVAAYYWYKELKYKRDRRNRRSSKSSRSDSGRRLTTTPVIGRGLIGGAATLRF